MNLDELTHGQKANKQSEELLRHVQAVIERYNFVLSVKKSKGPPAFALDRIKKSATELLVPFDGVFTCDAPIGQTMLRRPLHANFLLYKPDWPTPLALFPRCQTSSGSTHDKLGTLSLALKDRCECPGMILLEGPQFLRPEILEFAEWLRNDSNGWLLKVFAGVEQFRQWMMSASPYPKVAEPALL